VGVSRDVANEVLQIAETVRNDVLDRSPPTQQQQQQLQPQTQPQPPQTQPHPPEPAGLKQPGLNLSLYERLGGSAAIDAVVDKFYQRILADKRIQRFFTSTNIPRLRQMQKDFLTVAFGGPNRYSGQDMRAAHRRLVRDQGLNDSHFDAVLEDLRDTLLEVSTKHRPRFVL